jgi:hypothetical protein
MAELIRRSLYESLEPLARAQKEREMKTAAEVADLRRLREWNEGAQAVRSLTVHDIQVERGYSAE